MILLVLTFYCEYLLGISYGTGDPVNQHLQFEREVLHMEVEHPEPNSFVGCPVYASMILFVATLIVFAHS